MALYLLKEQSLSSNNFVTKEIIDTDVLLLNFIKYLKRNNTNFMQIHPENKSIPFCLHYEGRKK